MSYITNENITQALNGQPVYEILNAIHDEADSYFQRSVTRATAQNISNFGSGVNANPSLQNQFQTLLVNFVIPIAMESPELVNDFNWAVGEFIPDNKTLEEIAMDVIDPIEFDQYLSEDTEKQIFKPNVATRFYGVDREEQFPLTISRVYLSSAFDSPTAFLKYVAKLMNVLHSSNERSMYKNTVKVMTEYYSKDKFYRLEAPNVLTGTQVDAEHFIEMITEHSINMTLGVGTRVYNNQGFVTRTNMERLHLIITPKMLARIKLGVWAKVFNLSEAEFKPNVHLVDKFGDHDEIQAILVDEDFFRIHPRFREMSDPTNRRGHYTTYYYTCFDTFACSDFKNALVITNKELDIPVYDVVLPLSACDIRRGGSVDYEYIVRQTDSVKYVPVFTVEASDGGVTLSKSTKFDGTTLHVGQDEKNQFLVIKATVTFNDGTKDHKIIGRATAKVVK